MSINLMDMDLKSTIIPSTRGYCTIKVRSDGFYYLADLGCFPWLTSLGKRN